MKKLKLTNEWSEIKSCPICNSETFEYFSYSEEMWGIVEQHGHCHRCGYVIEQTYSPVYEAFWDVTRGFKHPYGYYVPRNVERHQRIRRKLGIKNIDVNPPWIYYI